MIYTGFEHEKKTVLFHIKHEPYSLNVLTNVGYEK